jgi:hypothetical protein
MDGYVSEDSFLQQSVADFESGQNISVADIYQSLRE